MSFFKLRKPKKALMGVGMLMLFIASIIASTVAAGVLITTTGILQERALRVEEVARERLISGLDVVSIYANGNTTSQTINELEFTTRLRAGSRPLQIGTMGFSFISGDLTFSAELNENKTGDACSFSNLDAQTEYCMEKLFGDNNSILDEGDLVILKYKLNESNSLETEQSFEISLQPKVGNLVVLELKAPDMVLTSKIRLR